ncbi:cardiolipin synthase [Peteryoungia desertarenae]|uniref:Phospholipase D n=1 Tax=Peteryoungia desertarenae TaxID=1813451 RepID=A0ABX6QQE7_9HYPH|nr:phospholipase D-like domain-containing protein [Peteryoungia desertarenae]QLF70834.1 cardiolipin synthase [Peteryoungia desertarenae]
MYEFSTVYWPHVLATLSVIFGTIAATHAAMTKREVRSALGWVGVIVLSPLIGAMIYGVVGINRIRRASIRSRRAYQLDEIWRDLSQYTIGRSTVESQFGSAFGALKRLGDYVTRHPLSCSNRISMLETGDVTYEAMGAAIDAAERSIILETYIFDRDEVGLRLADRLIEAHRRGVAVRVLVDAVGARYSVPSIIGHLRDADVPVETFNGKVIAGLRLPYANLRTHRKIMVVDGQTAFVGGMNIRADFAGPNASLDTHFKVAGPVVAEILSIAAEDWHFETGEALVGGAWQIAFDDLPPGEPCLARAVASGPDANLEANHKVLIGAFSVAQRSIRIMSPYFLPDNIFLSALNTAARRGVSVEIVLPASNNLALVGHAMMAQLEPVLREGCRVYRAFGPFDHSKLLTVDDQWSFVGSSNLDSRSLRLNFEIDLEVYDRDFTAQINRRIQRSIDNSEELDLPTLRARPFPLRLFERFLWLGSPYL